MKLSPSKRFWLLAVGFACLAGCLTTYSTHLYGSGLSPDSTAYIHLAREISANGFTFLTENKAVTQPPLYPITLAAISAFTKGDAIQAATLINILASAALLLVITFTVYRSTRSFPALIITGILSCFSIPLTRVWSMTWTEPLFILLVSLVLLLVNGTKHSTLSVFFAGILTTAACFTRYTGIALLPVVSAYLFFSQTGSIWKKCKSVILYATMPVLLFSIYVFRNYYLSGTPLGARQPGQLGFIENILLVSKTMLTWFVLPWKSLAYGGVLIFIFILLSTIIWYHRKSIIDGIRNSKEIVFLHLAFCAIYTGFIVWTSTTTAYDHIDDRLLSPIYPSLLILLGIFLNPRLYQNRRIRILALAGFCTLMVIAPLWATFYRINQNSKNGAGGYSSRAWRESQLIEYFQHNEQPEGIQIFSNAPEALYILSNVSATVSPARRHHNSEQTTGVTEENLFERYQNLDGAMLIWFNNNPRKHLFVPEDLKVMCELEIVKTLADGSIYRINRFYKHTDVEK